MSIKTVISMVIASMSLTSTSLASELAGAKFNGVAQINGIHIGMNTQQLKSALTQKRPSPGSCTDSAITLKAFANLYTYGDHFYRCDNLIRSGGQSIEMRLTTYKNKVNFIALGPFKDDNDDPELLAPFAKRLAKETFKTKPKIYVQKSERSADTGQVYAVWEDTQGSRILYSSDYETTMAGHLYTNGVLEIEGKNFNAIWKAREAEMATKK